MWCVYTNMEIRLKLKIVHSYPLIVQNLNQNHHHYAQRFKYENAIWLSYHENETHTKVALESP